MSEKLFEIQELKKYFHLGTKKTPEGRSERVLKAVDDVSFDIMLGECLGLVGESGSGKSTIGRCVINLQSPTDGKVVFRGEEISALRPESSAMKAHRRDMQPVFQNPRSSFNPKITVRSALNRVASFYGFDKEKSDEKIRELLDLTGLGSDILTHRPDELSGGQLQRLAIARALIPAPTFILADEALSSLDVSVQAQILELFDKMREKLGLTILFISHDLTVVEYICDRVIVLYLGAVMEEAATDKLFENPLHPYTKSLFAAKPKAYPEEEKNFVPLEGEIPGAVDLPPGCRFSTRCPVSVKGLCDCSAPEISEPEPGHKVCCHLLGK